MGVTYKLRDEVVHFIISERQGNPLYSCRQLAESASQKFGLHLSKSSVHDVLKESGIMTPRGRKPKNKFQIPQEKKKQIQVSLSQVKLISPPAEVRLIPDMVEEVPGMPSEEKAERSDEYEGAGKIFLKAALWDLGVFTDDNIKESDWDYYLTYSKGAKVILEDNKDFFIDLPLPIERCVREIADGLINNVKPLFVHKVSDEVLFKASMDAQPGFKIIKVLIVGRNDHILSEIDNIVGLRREFMLINRVFVESCYKNIIERSKAIFFSQAIDSNIFIEDILNLKGFDTTSKDENIVNLLAEDGYGNKIALEKAAEKLNGMYLRDEQNRLVSVKINACQG